MAQILFITEQYIKNKTPLTTNIDAKLIMPQVEYAQDSMIQDILGSKFYNSLQLAFSGQTLDTNQTYLVGLIQIALAYRAAERTIPFIHTQIRNSGTVNLNTDNGAMQSSLSEMKYIRDMLKEPAEFYELQVKNYLIYNAKLFPDYILPDAEGMLPNTTQDIGVDLYIRTLGVNFTPYSTGTGEACRGCGDYNCNGACGVLFVV